MVRPFDRRQFRRCLIIRSDKQVHPLAGWCLLLIPQKQKRPAHLQDGRGGNFTHPLIPSIVSIEPAPPTGKAGPYAAAMFLRTCHSGSWASIGHPSGDEHLSEVITGPGHNWHTRNQLIQAE